jgi:hypothetical protein
MKKLFVPLILAMLVLGSAAAQDLTVSGELKTGFYWQRQQIGNQEPEETGKLHNNDDAGSNQGRFRLNMQLDKENVGMKVRFELTQWSANNAYASNAAHWTYAFAYGYFWDNQIKISGGKMGDSPWGAGGPERWDELDTVIGIRTEITPNALPGLNVGFVLNDFNNGMRVGTAENPTTVTIGELLKETVFGISYTNDYFGLRFAYRLDSELDNNADRLDEGSQMLYRVEEKVLTNYLDGFKIWANGFYNGIQSDTGLLFYNWLYLQYAPSDFSSQLRVGFDASDSGERTVLHVRPSFYYHFFDHLLTTGLAFYYCQDFGTKYSDGSAYQYWKIEPQLRLNLANTTIALVYQYTSQYTQQDTLTKTHWVNLRLVYTF